MLVPPSDWEANIDNFIVKSGSIYTCSECGKQFQGKSAARNHLESIHFPSQGHNCDLCGKFMKTKHALYTHKSRYHK